MLTDSLPYWPINPSISTDIWFNFQLDMVRCLWVVLPGAILWGASFPLALAAVARPGQDAGRLVGGVYAANTVGAIVGSLGASLIVTRYIGSQHGQQALIIISALSALLMLAPAAAGDAGRRGIRWATTIALILATGAAGLFARRVPAGARPPRGLRTLCGDLGGSDEHHLRRRGAERLCRGVADLEWRAQLPQRRQGAGLERAAGHAPAAHARALHAPHSEDAHQRAGHRVRGGRHGWGGLDWPRRAADDDRRNRAARAGFCGEVLLAAQLRRRRRRDR